MRGRPADRGIDGQVLHRLHVERDADDAGHLLLDPPYVLGWGEAALVVRIQVDDKAAGVERLIAAVDADERT